MSDAEARDWLERLVSIPSVTGDEQAAVDWLVDTLDDAGWAAHRDEAGNAVAHLGDQGPHVVLLGHIDTVRGEVPVRREGGRLYGRGSVDAKGPLAAFAAAGTRAARLGRLGCRLEFVAAVDEEGRSRGARHRASGPAPDACVIGEPSGWDGLTLGYKGCLRVTLRRREPVAHGAGPAPGAAALACRTPAALEAEVAAFNSGRDALWDQLLLHLHDVGVETDGLHAAATLRLALRLPPDLPPGRARDWVAERAPGWSVEPGEALPAWSGARTSDLARQLSRAVLAEGGRPRFQRKTGTADLNVLGPAWGCPILAYGPGDAALDHTPDEHIELAEFDRGVAVLTRWLERPLG